MVEKNPKTIKAKVDKLLATPMTRKQFLGTLGLGVSALFGLSALVGVLSRNEKKDGTINYGQRDYGP